MSTNIDTPHRAAPYLKRIALGLGFLGFVAVLAVSLLNQTPRSVSAAEPVAQCNGVGGGGGEGYACFVVIDNYVTVNTDGTVVPAALSRIVTRVCNGAAGPFLATSPPLTKGPLPAALCGGAVTTFAPGPVTTVNQCNGTVGGGGAVLICSVTVNNHFIAGSPVTFEPVTIFQCEASATTGDIIECSPPSNIGSGAVTTVVQCNGSANGGGSAVRCTVNGLTVLLPLTINQCNGSGAAGTLVDCTTTVNDIDETILPTPTPTASATATPTASATATPTASATATPTVSPTAEATVSPTAEATVSPTAEATVSPTASPTLTAQFVPTASPTATATAATTTATATPTSTPLAALAPAQAPLRAAPGANVPGQAATATPTATPSGQTPAATTTVPRPPTTGNGGLVGPDEGNSSIAVWLLGAGAIVLVLGGRLLVARRGQHSGH